MKIDTIINQPVVETERMILRPLRRSDHGLLEMYGAGRARGADDANDPPSTAARRDRRPISIVHWPKSGTKTYGSWMHHPKGQAELVGLIALERMDREQSEIGYWVAPAFWNTGFAQEAVRGLLEANPLDNKTIFASVFQDNPASARVLTNNGFQYLGDAEAFSVARGATVPTWTYLKKYR